MSVAQVRAGAAKAEEFAEAAASNLGAGRNIAATSLAIHAAINSAGDDHDKVLVLLRQAGPDGANVERERRRLLPLKTKAECEPDDISPSVASRAFAVSRRAMASHVPGISPPKGSHTRICHCLVDIYSVDDQATDRRR